MIGQIIFVSPGFINMPTLVHRDTGLAININATGKPSSGNGILPCKASSSLEALGNDPVAATRKSPPSPSGGITCVTTVATAPPPLASATQIRPPLKLGDSTDIHANGRDSAPSQYSVTNSTTMSTNAAAQSPIKRTKKLAKPRKSAKGTTTYLPLNAGDIFLKSKGGQSLEPSALGENHGTKSSAGDGTTLTSSERSSITGMEGGVPASSSTILTKKKREKKKDGDTLTPKGKDKKIRKSKKRRLSLTSDGMEQIKTKRAKKMKPDKPVKVKKLKTTTRNVQDDGVQSIVKRKKKARSPKKSGSGELKRILSVVVDRVAEEIRHCASFFACGNRPRVVIGSANERVAETDSGNIKQGEQHTSQSSGMRSHDIGCAGQDASLNDIDNSDIRPHSDGDNHEGNQLSIGSSNADVGDANLVVIAVRRFVLEVYCPYLLSAKQSTGHNVPNVEHIQLSTLLVIREMMSMNADKLFAFSHLKRSSISMSERMHLSRIFADAIVRNAAKRLQITDKQKGLPFVEKFLRTMNDYDSGSEPFQFSLAPVDDRTVCARHGGGEMGPEETIIAKVGFNYARERHPLLLNRRLTMEDEDEEGLVHELPKAADPTACAVFEVPLCSPHQDG